MKQSGFLLTFILILSACGPAPTPAATPDIQGTAAVYAGTMVASTLTAQPTATLAPTQTQLPTATATLQSTDTTAPEPSGALTLTPTPDASMGVMATPTVFTGTFAPGNTTGLPTALLYIQNNTGVKEIIVSLTGTTLTREQPVYYSYKVGAALLITILLGHYQIMVQIPSKGYVRGDFIQSNKDKTIMRVDYNKVVTHGP
jgi:hypothetical protein